MNFHRHGYELMVVLGDPAREPLWRVSAWERWFPSLAAVASGDRGTGGLRVDQYRGKKLEKYGKLSFKPESFSRWLHADGDDRLLVAVQIWSPGWGVCERADMAPDVFINIWNELASRCYQKPAAFNPLIVAARRIDSRHPLSIKRMIETTRDVCGGHVFTGARVPWGLDSGPGFTRAIQDLAGTALFKMGKVHERPVDEDTFDPALGLMQVV